MPANGDDVLFEARTPLGFVVRVTRQRWELITGSKHPVMAGREGDVKLALESPDEVRRSVSNDQGATLLQGRREPGGGCAPSRNTLTRVVF